MTGQLMCYQVRLFSKSVFTQKSQQQVSPGKEAKFIHVICFIQVVRCENQPS